MMHKAWSSIKEVPYCFSMSHIKFQGHTAQRNRRFWLKIGVFGFWLQFEFTNGYEVMHKAWSSIEEVPYCFSRSNVKFQGHTAQKMVDFDPNWVVPDCNSQFEFTNGYEMMHKAWSSIEEVPYCFQGHTSNCKVTRLKKSSILTQNLRFWILTPVWIQQWLWSDAQSLK